MPRSYRGGLVGRLLEAAAEATGASVVESGELDRMRHGLMEAYQDRRLADLLAYQVLNDPSYDERDPKYEDRLKVVKQAREVWRRDPQGGRSVTLLNDFTFGRGVPKPRAKDDAVQEVIDEAWDDPQNQRTLTSYDAQRRKGTDLATQSNVFLLMFKGDDGRVKLSTLNHDTVRGVVRDDDVRERILYYYTVRKPSGWNYDEDRPKRGDELPNQGRPVKMYYAHWSNVDEATEEGSEFEKPPKDKLGEGSVYQVAVNADSEMAFGWPEMQRVVRWYSAYNEFMASRVDLAKAAAQFVMKRKVQGGQTTVERMAAKQLSRSGELAAAVAYDVPPQPDTASTLPIMPAKPGSTITENAGVSHEPFNLNTNAANAQGDATMLLAQGSAGSGWPPHYMGNGDSASLATATAMELPVLKMVEARQEVFEAVFRWFIDRVIEEAVDSGRLDRYASDAKAVSEAHEDKGADETRTERDLSYEFAMPNPLKRAIGELMTAIASIAQTFDPNGTNLNLTRYLLGVALSQVLDADDAQAEVEQIFPDGYVDPALEAYQQQQDAAAATAQAAQAQAAAAPQQQPDQVTTTGADGKQHKGSNAYGAKQKSQTPEQAAQESLWRDDRELALESLIAEAEGADAAAALWETEVESVVEGALFALAGSSNGNGYH